MAAARRRRRARRWCGGLSWCRCCRARWPPGRCCSPTPACSPSSAATCRWADPRVAPARASSCRPQQSHPAPCCSHLASVPTLALRSLPACFCHVPAPTQGVAQQSLPVASDRLGITGSKTSRLPRLAAQVVNHKGVPLKPLAGAHLPTSFVGVHAEAPESLPSARLTLLPKQSATLPLQLHVGRAPHDSFEDVGLEVGLAAGSCCCGGGGGCGGCGGCGGACGLAAGPAAGPVGLLPGLLLGLWACCRARCSRAGRACPGCQCCCCHHRPAGAHHILWRHHGRARAWGGACRHRRGR
jgi:hypothetical protein